MPNDIRQVERKLFEFAADSHITGQSGPNSGRFSRAYHFVVHTKEILHGEYPQSEAAG
jgi:hypothetical protein